jgi:hypothetical protein
MIKSHTIAIYSWYTGGTDTSDIKYWKKVAFSTVTKIALHSYIQYEESYQGQRKLKVKL